MVASLSFYLSIFSGANFPPLAGLFSINLERQE